MRASIAAEAEGYPSVSLICEGFRSQAAATGRGLGFDGLSLAVFPGHVDAQTDDELIKNLLDRVMGQIVSGLTIAGTSTAAGTATNTATSTTAADTGERAAEEREPTATETVISGTLAEVNDRFIERGWSDGLPIVPPTIAQVEAFLSVTGHDPWRTLGIAKSSGRDMTVWSVAVNAVMAGCRPEHLPILLAAAEILADPGYGAEHSGNTTGADALMILNGPSAEPLGFNSGPGALRDGVHANTSVGRWLRLYLRNVFGFTADEHDKATFGNSFRVVLAEDQRTLDDIGWPTVGQDFGFGDGDGRGDEVLTMARFNSGSIIGSVFGSSPAEILPYLGDGVARTCGWDLTHVYGLGQGHFRPLLVLSPILARVFARAGWSKDDVRGGLFDHARIPAWRFEKLIGEWSNLTAGRRSLADLAADGLVPEVFGESEDPNRLVPVVTEPSKFVIAVAGDPDRTNAYTLSNDGPHGDYTAKPIDYGFSEDLVCNVPSPAD